MLQSTVKNRRGPSNILKGVESQKIGKKRGKRWEKLSPAENGLKKIKNCKEITKETH